MTGVETLILRLTAFAKATASPPKRIGRVASAFRRKIPNRGF